MIYLIADGVLWTNSPPVRNKGVRKIDLCKPGCGDTRREGSSADGAHHWIGRRGFPPPCDPVTCILTQWLSKGWTPSFPQHPHHYTSAGSSAAGRSGPCPGGHCKPSRDRVCFNLLCAFLNLTPHELTVLVYENLFLFRHGNPFCITETLRERK